MAAKFFTGLPLDGPDPECVSGDGELALAGSRRHGAAAGGGPLQAAAARPVTLASPFVRR